MGICWKEEWWVSCDEPGCRETSENTDIPSDSEDDAEAEALGAGFVSFDRRWYCAEHAVEALRRPAGTG